MTKPTKADIACYIGSTLAQALRNRDESLQGYDIAVLTSAFIAATIDAAKPADRPAIRQVTTPGTETRNLWLAKAVAACDRRWSLISQLSPERSAAAAQAADPSTAA